MFKNYIIYFVLVLFSFNYAQYFEVDFGYNYANGAFDKYTDDGFSLRATYSNNIKSSKFFRWQGSFQYISFYNDTWQDCIQLGSGNCGPTIDVTNSEDGYTIQGGLRFTPEKGLFQKKSIFKPYAALNLGVIYLQEKTVYSDPDEGWDDWSGNGGEYDYFTLDDIEDYRFNFIYSVELGSNLNFKKWNGFGLDLGVRYNMCPSINKTELDMPPTGPVEFKNTLDADYFIYYIGVTFDLNIFNNSNFNNDSLEI